MKRREALIAVGLAMVAVTAGWSPGYEHARISLKVEGPGGGETAYVDQTPPAWGKNPRPIVRVKAGEAIQYEYLLTNVYPHKTLEGVVVHFYVAAIGSVGEKELPNLEGDGLVTETAFDLDLGPGRKVGGRGKLQVDRPGVYLVRIESRQTGSDHEHFAAIDLIVTPPGG